MYKDSLFAAQCRREGLLRSLTPLPRRLVNLYAYRQARLWAGVIGLGGFLALIISVLLGGRFASQILLINWGAMITAFGLVTVISRRRAVSYARRVVETGDDAFADVARLEAGGPQARVARRAHRLETASFVVPMLALTLVTPLFMHLVIGTAVLGVELHHFDAWVLISLLLVGHAHLTLLIFSVMHVLRTRSELDRGLPVTGAVRGFWALLWTVAASSIPGAVLLCIPPILVALTGLLFVPWMFHWVSCRAQIERAVLEQEGLLAPAAEVTASTP